MQDQKRQWLQIFFIQGLLLTITAVASGAQPVQFGRMTSTPGWRKDPFGSGKLAYHSGYDIACPSGTPVYPTQSGTVSYAGPYKGYGNLVAVDHANGYVTMYGHLSRILVPLGQAVTPETTIALSGNTGRSTGAHLHYEIRAYPVAVKREEPSSIEEPLSQHEDDWVDVQLQAVPQDTVSY